MCKDADTLLHELKCKLEDGFLLDELYEKRILDFYGTFDKGNCERNYSAIKQIEDC